MRHSYIMSEINWFLKTLAEFSETFIQFHTVGISLFREFHDDFHTILTFYVILPICILDFRQEEFHTCSSIYEYYCQFHGFKITKLLALTVRTEHRVAQNKTS